MRIKNISSEIEPLAIAELFRRGRDAWPQISLDSLDEGEFARYVEEHADTSLPREKLRGNDLYLACALAKSDPQAVEQFDRHFISAAFRLLRSRNFNRDEVDEACQALRIKLLVGPPPKIKTYRGRGPLLTWVLVTAVRDAVKQYRRRNTQQTQSSLVETLVGSVRIEEDSMKRAYQREFRRAFAIAIESLTARDRTLLKLHTLEQLRLEEIGVIYGAHRATVARWLQKIRHHICETTKTSLSDEFALKPEDVDDVIALLSSQLDASIQRLLKTPLTQSPDTH